MKQMNLALNKPILNKIEELRLSLTQYLILTLYQYRNVYNRELLETLINERNRMTELVDFGALCRKGYLKKLENSTFGDIDNYQLTVKGQIP